MRRKTWLTIFCCAATLCLLLFVTSSSKNSNVIAGDDPPPYKTGISSPGARPIEPPDNALREARDVGYYEDKVDWLALNVRQPRTAWEHLQYALYLQQDLLKEDEAIEEFKIAASMDFDVTGGKMIMPHARLCEIYLERGDYDGAISECTTVSTLDPLLNGPNERIGKAYFGKGDTERAIEFLNKELEVQGGTNQLVFFELAEVYMNRGEKAKALEFFEKYLAEAKYHEDTYPLRIRGVEKEVEELKHELGISN